MSTWMILHSDDNVYLSTSSEANVITINGELRQFPTPITASQLLVKSSLSSSSFFICNSDSLYYDQNIPALNSTEELQSGQIYFILAKSKLNYPLSASHMAALAVKASTAISSMNNNKSSGGKSHHQISPPPLMTQGDMNTNTSRNINKSSGGGLGISRSGSMGKFVQRYSTRPPKLLPTRSFQRLTTIHEASHLQAYWLPLFYFKFSLLDSYSNAQIHAWIDMTCFVLISLFSPVRKTNTNIVTIIFYYLTNHNNIIITHSRYFWIFFSSNYKFLYFWFATTYDL